jgi:hypothetical protein
MVFDEVNPKVEAIKKWESLAGIILSKKQFFLNKLLSNYKKYMLNDSDEISNQKKTLTFADLMKRKKRKVYLMHKGKH